MKKLLCMEFELRKIPFMRQERVGITYKGRPVGKGKLDLLVGGRLIVELKSVDRLAPIHSARNNLLFANDKPNAWLADQL
jgi:GxxExxY protein